MLIGAYPVAALLAAHGGPRLGTPDATPSLHILLALLAAVSAASVLAVVSSARSTPHPFKRITGGPEVVGKLASQLAAATDTGVRRAIEVGVLQRLPKLDADTYHALGHKGREHLTRAARSTTRAALALAILRTIERFADTEALPEARRMAAGDCESAADKRVPKATRRCVDALEEAERRQQQAGTLLRPSAAPADATLLRPAGGTPTTPGSQLLRPVLGAEDEAGEPEGGSGP